METYRKTKKNKMSTNQAWIRESVTCKEDINTPTTSALRWYL